MPRCTVLQELHGQALPVRQYRRQVSGEIPDFTSEYSFALSVKLIGRFGPSGDHGFARVEQVASRRITHSAG